MIGKKIIGERAMRDLSLIPDHKLRMPSFFPM
jgi:hypothetical protein